MTIPVVTMERPVKVKGVTVRIVRDSFIRKKALRAIGQQSHIRNNFELSLMWLRNMVQPCFLACLSAFFLITVLLAAEVRSETDFSRWINEFYAVASKAGISQKTYREAFAGVDSPDEKVLKKAAYQPEFKTKIWDYLDARVTGGAVAKGQKMGRYYARTLESIEEKFGLRAEVLLAIWSMESNYGAVLRKTERLHSVPRALATLAYADPKRQKFGRTQLLAALKILEAGDIEMEQFIGSWAGAMGHTQFIPTSYLAYGYDMDGNGRRDIWNSIPDALATAANLLRKNGWINGKTWGYEVVPPAGSSRYDGETKLLSEWRQLGFVRVNGNDFPRPGDRAELKLPAGEKGPGFLLMKNFFVIKRYNNADAYALAVGLLTDRIAGYGGLVQAWPRPEGSLLPDEKTELQVLLKQKGYYSGAIDGALGKGTRSAVQQFQIDSKIIADGLPTKSILLLLRR